MSTLLTRLAHWAAELDAARVPDEVLHLALLQHISLAGAAHAAAALPMASSFAPNALTRGSAPLMGLKRLGSRRDAVRVNSALIGALESDDLIFLGPGSPAGAAVCWSYGKGHSLRDLLVAQVIANELGARLQAAALLSPYAGPGLGPAHALSAAAAGARLLGLEADATAHAYALALATSAVTSSPARYGALAGLGAAIGAAALAGLDAVELARTGSQGPVDLLDHDDGLFTSMACPLPLRNAFTGLGEAWLTRTLTVRAVPVAYHALTPVESTLEILRRHVKAAEKRLRTDQVERVEIRVSAPALALDAQAERHPGLDLAAAGSSLGRAVALAIAGHGLGAEQRNPDWIRAHRAVIDDLAGRVQVVHHWPLTVRWAAELQTALGPLLAGVSARRLRCATRGWRRQLPPLGAPATVRDLVELAQARPDQLLTGRDPGSDDLSGLDLSQWRSPWPVEVKLYTTRGGWWPERRDTVENGARGGVEAQRAAALRRLQEGAKRSAEEAQAIAETSLNSAADSFVYALA